MNKKRLSALILAAAMTAFSGMTVMTPVYAADTYTVDITNGGADSASHTYTAYQVFKADVNADKILSNVEWGDDIDQSSVYNNLAAAGFSTCTDIASTLDFLSGQAEDSENMIAFANAIAASLKSDATGKGTKTVASGETGSFSGLDGGYYLFKEDDSSSLTPTPASYSRFILKVVDNVDVTAKKDVPKIEKKIDEGENGVVANVASIGDTVPYIVKTEVPDMRGYNEYYFIVNDRMEDGLTFDSSSVAITMGGQPLTKDNDYVIKEGNDAAPDTFQIVFKDFIQYKYVKYTADPAGSYYKLADGSYTDITPTQAAEKMYESTTVKYKLKDKENATDPDVYVVDENGTYYRLANGTYTNVAPENYTWLYEDTTTTYKIDESLDDIVIKYNAVLNEEADRTKKGNKNTVDLTFSNNPNHEYGGDDEPTDSEKNDDKVIGKTPESNTKTYTTGIKVVKVDAKTGERLEGAEFELAGDALNQVVYTTVTEFEASDSGTYYKLKNGTYTDEVPTSATEQYYDSTTTMYKIKTSSEQNKPQESGKVSNITDISGVATFEGLGAGTYTLKETKAPDGYNLLSDETSIVIDAAPTLEGPGWTLNGEAVSLEDGQLFIKEYRIENNKGVTLPGTGGIGTTLFYVIGGLLVAGSGVLFVTKKRMNITDKK